MVKVQNKKWNINKYLKEPNLSLISPLRYLNPDNSRPDDLHD